MMQQYILLIHGHTKSPTQAKEWDDFFAAARASGIFKGGSEIGTRELIGDKDAALSTNHVVGYMRFDSDEKSKILDLLNMHPVVLNGGTVELCELPKS